MKRKQTLRATLFALSASIVLPTAPVSGQETAPPPLVAPPSPVTTTTAPPPRIVVTPPTAQQPAPAPAPRVTLPPVPEVETPAPETRGAPARTSRAAPRARAATPRAAPAVAPAETAAPVPVAEISPTTVEPLPPAAPALSPATGTTGEAAEPAVGPSPFWLIAGLAGLALIALITFLALRRRRADEEVHYEERAFVEEPAAVGAEPVAAALEPSDYQEPLIAPAPVVAREPAPTPVREVAAPTVSAADETDVAALAASSNAGGERPWLEFLLRPVRAGTSSDETIVQYDLTIANTGGRDASEVRVTSWLFPAGTSEMEQSLIDGPAEARAAEADIAAGEGVRIQGEASLAKAGLSDETVLPVLVAEARYRLPDGREGRTRASFEIGMSADGHIAPFPIDRATGLVEFVEARLHGEPERV